jgi:hypothetical protein
MKLKSLHVSQNYIDKKQYLCRVEFEGSHGEVRLNLDEAVSRKILEVCAELVAEAGRQTAEHMVAAVIEAVNPIAQIEGTAD